MRGNAKKVMIGTGLLALGAATVGAVSYSTTRSMVKLALDREMPPHIKIDEKSKKRLSGCTLDNALMEQLAQAGESLRLKQLQTIEIISHDGEKLIGHWRPCEYPRRVILAMHGWRSAWNKDFGIISDFWHSNGCSVLYAEQRGQGDSGGEYMGFGMTERFDCLDWIRWINDHCGGTLHIYLAGISMGASTVLMATGLELPENVRGVIADCGFTSAHAIWKHVAENNLGISYGIRGAIANDLCKRKIHVGADDYSTLDALRLNRIPVLFIHGTEDHFVPVEMTYENYKACAAPKRLLIVPGADHGMSYLLNREGYEKAMLDLWKETEKP